MEPKPPMPSDDDLPLSRGQYRMMLKMLRRLALAFVAFAEAECGIASKRG